MEPALWGFIGTLVGALASIATTYLQSRQTHSLQRQSSIDERAERHRAFQRETLIELQDALHALHRMAARGYHEDLMAFHRRGGEWGSGMWSDEVNEGQGRLSSRVMVLRSRVQHDELRARVKHVTELASLIALSRSKDDAERCLAQLSAEGPDVLERIGNELRLLY